MSGLGIVERSLELRAWEPEFRAQILGLTDWL